MSLYIGYQSISKKQTIIEKLGFISVKYTKFSVNRESLEKYIYRMKYNTDNSEKKIRKRMKRYRMKYTYIVKFSNETRMNRHNFQTFKIPNKSTPFFPRLKIFPRLSKTKRDKLFKIYENLKIPATQFPRF